MKQMSSFLVGVWVLLSVLLVKVPMAGALTITSSRDNDNNAVIINGALNCSELQTGYNNSGVGAIYSSFGISASDINNCNNMVEGVVTNKNNVWIHRSSGLCPNTDNSALGAQNQQAVQNNPNLCLVGTNAMTAGRQNIAGSIMTTSGGVTFFKRPPSVSFLSSSLPAFVVMDSNHQFRFAIIASCGNPVVATAVPVMATPAKTTTITPQRPTQTQTQTQSQTITVNVPQVQAATTTQPASTPTSTVKTLPNTGPGNILALSGATTAIGTIGHWYYSRRRPK